MSEGDLNRAVARATGETIRTVARLGFSLVEPDLTNEDQKLSEIEPKMVDWDALDEQRVALMPA
jgi:hypothetical protein